MPTYHFYTKNVLTATQTLDSCVWARRRAGFGGVIDVFRALEIDGCGAQMWEVYKTCIVLVWNRDARLSPLPFVC
jgi:hypothetical protein